MQFYWYGTLYIGTDFPGVFLVGFSIILLRAQRKREIEYRMLGTFDDDPFAVESEEPGGFMNFLVRVRQLHLARARHTSLWEQMVQAATCTPTRPPSTRASKPAVCHRPDAQPVDGAAREMPLGTKMSIVSMAGPALFFVPNMFLHHRLPLRGARSTNICPRPSTCWKSASRRASGSTWPGTSSPDEIRQVSGVLAGSMSLTSFEMHLGISRIDANEAHGRANGRGRTQVPGAILIQTDRFGTSIAETLKVFAQSIREERSFTARKPPKK